MASRYSNTPEALERRILEAKTAVADLQVHFVHLIEKREAAQDRIGLCGCCKSRMCDRCREDKDEVKSRQSTIDRFKGTINAQLKKLTELEASRDRYIVDHNRSQVGSATAQYHNHSPQPGTSHGRRVDDREYSENVPRRHGGERGSSSHDHREGRRSSHRHHHQSSHASDSYSNQGRRHGTSSR